MKHLPLELKMIIYNLIDLKTLCFIENNHNIFLLLNFFTRYYYFSGMISFDKYKISFCQTFKFSKNNKIYLSSLDVKWFYIRESQIKKLYESSHPSSKRKIN